MKRVWDDKDLRPFIACAEFSEDCAALGSDEPVYRVALHSQYPITTDFDRGYDKARKDAAETLRQMQDGA